MFPPQCTSTPAVNNATDAHMNTGSNYPPMYPRMSPMVMNQPCLPMPYSPFPQNLQISSEDIQKIAMAVKSVIQNDIQEIVAVETGPLKEEIKTLKRENMELRLQVDDLEQYGRRPLIRISGIPESPSENTTDKILQVTMKAGMNLSENDIKVSHRVGKQSSSRSAPRQIIAKLDSVNKKFELLKNTSQLKNNPETANIRITEDLTRYRDRLSFFCRQLIRRKLLKQTWTTNGKIYVRDINDHVHTVRVEQDLCPFGHVPT